MPPILIFAPQAESLVDHLTPLCPNERFLGVSDPARVPAALAEADPEIAFTINGPDMPSEAHQAILAAPTLKWFHVGGSGYEHIGAWNRAEKTVTNGAGVLAPFLAETCIGAILALNHGLIRYRDQQRARLWCGHNFRPLSGQTLVIVGAGAIGGEVAWRATALGLRVLAIRRSSTQVAGAEETRPPAALDPSLAEADIVSVHLRRTVETEGLFDADRLRAIKPGALFLNTARGGIVDEGALYRALASGHLGAAYLDVFATEPLPPESPLWAAPNLLITPHSADGIAGWSFRFADYFAENLKAWRAGRPLANRI